MRLYISGLNSDSNPSPGVGVARSLRAGYPNARLTGVDFSVRSSGLHWTDFDDIWLNRPWTELDLDSFVEQVADRIARGGFWIPGLDLEARLLAAKLGRSPGLIGPSASAMAAVAKPCTEVASRLQVRSPETLPLAASTADQQRFCRFHGWRVWLKGPYYEARRVGSWGQFQALRDSLAETWSTERLHLQEDVIGHEESIAFAAVAGHIVGMCRMVKRVVTQEGKTWAGRVTPVPDSIAQRLRDLVADIEWTGGAELEFIRSTSQELWLLEWNPRFPAWIHGATIAGKNIPALLVARATGQPMIMFPPEAEEFVRVVLEVPCRKGYALPPLAEPTPSSRMSSAGKHPSGMPLLARRLLSATVERVHEEPIPVSKSLTADLEAFCVDGGSTPFSALLSGTTQQRWRRSAHAAAIHSGSQLDVRLAYSIKTNPDVRLLALARREGLMAEAISRTEVALAMDRGFAPADIILNGPGKHWPTEASHPNSLFALFSDSVEELEKLGQARTLPAEYVGIRLRLPGVESRFGVRLDPYSCFMRVVEAVASLPQSVRFAAHFHLASSTIGVKLWWQVLETALSWAKTLEGATGRSVECLDVGGGWFPDDWEENFLPAMGETVHRISQALSGVRTLIVEPGKALSQPAAALVVSVLEAREAGDKRELVVDGSVAELPEAAAYPHRVMHRAEDGTWAFLRRGSGRILGRLCMENDILRSNVNVPSGVQVGDRLVFCDAGAYDASMSYSFGKG